MNYQIVLKTLLSLNGREFTSRDDLEDAVLPLYGPLTAIFTGEGHRDMVDRLLAARWVVFENGKLIVRFPESEIQQAVEPKPMAVEGNPKADAINAIMNGNYKEAIRILTNLL